VGAKRLKLEDPLAHFALDALRRADAAVTRRLAAELEREGISGTGFEMLVILRSAGGRIELRELRRELRTSKANATEVLDTLERRGLIERRRSEDDRRAITISLSQSGRLLLAEAFPGHAVRVRRAFGVLAEDEKRQLADLCRKLAQAA